MKFDITDRIQLEIVTDDNRAIKSAELFKDYISKETLATEFKVSNLQGSDDLLDFKLNTNIRKN